MYALSMLFAIFIKNVRRGVLHEVPWHRVRARVPRLFIARDAAVNPPMRTPSFLADRPFPKTNIQRLFRQSTVESEEPASGRRRPHGASARLNGP